MAADRTPPLPKLIADRHANVAAYAIGGAAVALCAIVVLALFTLLSGELCLADCGAIWPVAYLLERGLTPREPLLRAKQHAGRLCTRCAYPLTTEAEGDVACPECGTLQNVRQSTASWHRCLAMYGMLDRDPALPPPKASRIASSAARVAITVYSILALAAGIFVVWVLIHQFSTYGTVTSFALRLLAAPVGLLIGGAIGFGFEFDRTRRCRQMQNDD